MKKLYILIFISFLFACQEEEIFEKISESSAIASESELSDLVSRLNQNPTAFDNFIDDSDAVRLEFPFEVTVNSDSDFSINEFSDYQPLIDELASLSEDYEIIINFPLEVSLPNYERISLRNNSELQVLKASVQGSSEINCLNYNFPVEVNIFDTQNSLTNNRIIQNGAQFYNLIEDLKQTDGFYEIIYPIDISINGVTQTISSNFDLEAAIQNLDAECFNPFLFLTSRQRLQKFIAFITSGEFRVFNYVSDDGENETNTYESFVFDFNSNNTITIRNTSTLENYSGTWEVEIDDNNLVFELDFEENDLLEELDEDWIINAFANPNRIILIDDDSDEESILIFEKI